LQRSQKKESFYCEKQKYDVITKLAIVDKHAGGIRSEAESITTKCERNEQCEINERCKCLIIEIIFFTA